jgi:exonuclease VII large subunit
MTMSKIVLSAIVVLGLGLLTPAGAAEAPARGQKITQQQFDALPSNGVIEFKGKKIPKSEIQARAAKRKEAMAKVPAAATKAQQKVEQRRVQFDQKQQEKLTAENQKIKAEFAKLEKGGGGSGADSRRAAIEKEARELSARYKTASAAEKAQIDRRADELARELGK